MKEKRKLNRFTLKDSAFAVFRPEFKKLGKIIDISRDGLACEYLAHYGINKYFQKLKIDIVLSNDKFYMPMIPCRVIYDFKLIKGGSTFHDSLESRRCGLRFWEISKKLKEQLEFFLKEHAIETT